jgi:hypothetical protein
MKNLMLIFVFTIIAAISGCTNSLETKIVANCRLYLESENISADNIVFSSEEVAFQSKAFTRREFRFIYSAKLETMLGNLKVIRYVIILGESCEEGMIFLESRSYSKILGFKEWNNLKTKYKRLLKNSKEDSVVWPTRARI